MPGFRIGLDRAGVLAGFAAQVRLAAGVTPRSSRHHADHRCRHCNCHQVMTLGKAVEQHWFSRRGLAMSLDGSNGQAVPVTAT